MACWMLHPVVMKQMQVCCTEVLGNDHELQLHGRCSDHWHSLEWSSPDEQTPPLFCCYKLHHHLDLLQAVVITDPILAALVLRDKVLDKVRFQYHFLDPVRATQLGRVFCRHAMFLTHLICSTLACSTCP